MSKTNWQTIANALEARITGGELKAGERLPSDVGLAEEWGVSRPTAHRAMHELQRKGMVARSRGAGTVVAETTRPPKTHRIALIYDQVGKANDFQQADLIRGIHEGIGDDYNLLWCDSKGDPAREAQFLRRMHDESDGILCMPIVDSRNMGLLRSMVKSNHPLVLLDRLPDELEAYAAMSDNVTATKRAVQELVDRGHKRIAFLSFHKPHFSTVRDRFKAYMEVMEASGLPLQQRDVRWFSAELEHGAPVRLLQAVEDSIYAMTHQSDPITAVFSVQDLITKTVMVAAEASGVSVGEQLEIATFNDWPPMMLGRPWDLHRVTQRTAEIGRTAATMLHELIEGRRPADRVVQVPAEFFVADAGLRPTHPTFAILSTTNGGYELNAELYKGATQG